MGAYATQSDLENVFGVRNIAAWSNLDNDDSGADTTRITTAITVAEERVEDRFATSKYKIPFVRTDGSVPPIVCDWVSRLAGIWLYDNRGISNDEDTESRYQKVEDKVLKQMDEYLSGRSTIRNAVLTYDEDTTDAPTVE